MRSIIIDAETTGLTMPSCVELEKQPRIIELAMVLCEDGTVIKELDWLIHPGEALTPEITKLTGLTDAMLADRPTFAQLLPAIKTNFLGSDILYAHNAPFDVACLEYELKRTGCFDFPWPPEMVCTVQEYVHEFGFRPKLTELYERKLGKPFKQQHRAMGDVRALVEVLIQEGLV